VTRWLRATVGAKALFYRFVRDREAADLIEYVLLGTAIALAAYAGVTAVGSSLDGAFTIVTDRVVSQGVAGAALSGGGQ
jgi:Flp pilus assembly pilin Flp